MHFKQRFCLTTKKSQGDCHLYWTRHSLICKYVLLQQLVTALFPQIMIFIVSIALLILESFCHAEACDWTSFQCLCITPSWQMPGYKKGAWQHLQFFYLCSLMHFTCVQNACRLLVGSFFHCVILF